MFSREIESDTYANNIYLAIIHNPTDCVDFHKAIHKCSRYNPGTKKTLILSSIVLAFVLAGCSEYSSQGQAMDACNEWEEQGEVIRYKLVGADGITYDDSNKKSSLL